MKRFLLTAAFGFLLSVALYAQQLEIHHIDVGQADATLIKSPTGVTMLIDAGNNGDGTNIILPYLNSLGISSLNYIVCSHYHSDHLGGLDEVINSLGASNIGAIYDRGSDAPLPATSAFSQYLVAANSTGKRYSVILGQMLDLGGGVTMKCLATDGYVINYGLVGGATSSENDLSIGWLLTFSSFHYFTGGDLGGESTYYADSETPLGPQVGNVNVMKVNHHGSQYSTNQSFLNNLKPEAAVIEVGNGNTYGHPVQATLDRLTSAHCYIYQTELGSGGTIPSGKGTIANGNIIVKSSGSNFTVTFGAATESKNVVNVPSKWSLSQNYPNPFNPSTTISYSVGKHCNTSLKIFDLLGREIATLVNETKSPGVYSVTWSAANYSSGMYLYRLISGNYSATKSLFLLK